MAVRDILQVAVFLFHLGSVSGVTYYTYYYYYYYYYDYYTLSTGGIVGVSIGCLVFFFILAAIIIAVVKACTKTAGEMGRVVQPTVAVVSHNVPGQPPMSYPARFKADGDNKVP